MAQAIVEEMDITSITWGRGTKITNRPQFTAVKNMKDGEALALTHDGFDVSKCTGTSLTCTMHGSLAVMTRRSRPDVSFSFRHLPDGRLGVACFAKDS